MRSLRDKLTYSNVMSTIAVFGVLAGGTAIAASKVPGINGVNSADIKNGAVKLKDLNSQVTAGLGDEADPVPAGTVAFFNLAACPSGWSEVTAARGRYLVGLPAGGALAATQGTALSNLQNRAVGQHNHTVNDPGHSHSTSTSIGEADTASNAMDVAQGSVPGSSLVGVLPATTGISLSPAGSVAGTNAPYIQLLVCQKS